METRSAGIAALRRPCDWASTTTTIAKRYGTVASSDGETATPAACNFNTDVSLSPNNSAVGITKIWIPARHDHEADRDQPLALGDVLRPGLGVVDRQDRAAKPCEQPADQNGLQAHPGRTDAERSGDVAGFADGAPAQPGAGPVQPKAGDDGKHQRCGAVQVI